MAIKKRDVQALIDVIAGRLLTTTQVAERFGYTVDELRDFVEEYTHQLEERRWQLESDAADALREAAETLDPVPKEELDGYWITNKQARILRYQQVAEDLLRAITAGAWDATTLREARSYMMYAATELGQIPLRGQGKNTDDDENASFELVGIDMGKLA